MKIRNHHGISYRKLSWRERFKIRFKYKYELMKDYSIFISEKDLPLTSEITTDYINVHPMAGGAMLTVKAGYQWDGTSGYITVDTKSSMRGSLLHDVLYQLCRMGKIAFKLVSMIDKFFVYILRKDGFTRLRAWLYLKGVDNRFVHKFAKPKGK